MNGLLKIAQVLVSRSRCKQADDTTALLASGGGLAGLILGAMQQAKASNHFVQEASRPGLATVDVSSIKDLPVLRTRDEVTRHIGSTPLFLRLGAPGPESRAAYYLSNRDTGGKPAYLFPGSTALKAVYDHEHGHAMQDNDPMGMKREPLKSVLLGLLLGMKHTPLYRQEVDAWNRAGVAEDDPLRVAALRSYEGVTAPPRYAAVGALAGTGLGYLVNKLRAVK